MKKILIFVVVLLISTMFASADPNSYNLTKCKDSDGDNPNAPGNLIWEYSDILGGSGGGNDTDICSTVHYTNILLNVGENFENGEFVMVEGVCPNIGTIADQPANFPIKKFYKCRCDNEGTICNGNALEIPLQKIIDAEFDWKQRTKIGDFSLNLFLIKFINFFKFWG